MLEDKIFRQVIAVIANGPTHKDENMLLTTMASHHR